MRCIRLVLAACLIATLVVGQVQPPPPTSSSHHLCLHLSSGGVGTFYDVVADSSQTVLKRYNMATNPPTLLDTNVYAALAKPNPQGSAFDVGVAFAANMQTRGVWMYPASSQTSAAFWDELGADGDRWRFYAPGIEIMLATQNCAGFQGGQPPAQATPQPPAPQPTPAPPTAPPATPAAGSHRVCVHYSSNGVGTYYDITTDASQTVMKRYNMATNPPTLIDVNNYAALAKPNPQGSNFDVGVAFAATMQTRNAWMYPASSQTSGAFWDELGVDGDRWRFYAPGLEVTLATQNCQNF